MADRLLSEKEVGEIMKRAAELQEQGSATGYVPGVTKLELSRMASEIGIDAKYLEIAMSERRDPKLGKEVPMYPTIERVYPVELGPEDFDVVTEYIKPYPSYGTNGTATPAISQVGRTLTGKAACSWANPDFKVTSRDGRTRVVVTSDQGTPVGLALIWVLPMVGSVVAMAKVSPLAGFIGLATSAVMSLFTYRGAARKSGEMTQKVADQIERSVNEFIDSRPRIPSEAASVVEDEQIQARLSE
ncbi:MAG: hypothetical protein JNJ45_05285 [Chthonomonas sp.]|nr:hypothetical protein [Chthonomonas sp.]